MAPRLRLSSRQLPTTPTALGTGNATFTIISSTLSEQSLQTDSSNSGTGITFQVQTITETNSPTPTPSSSLSTTSRKNEDGGLGIPVIVGISVGTFAFLALLLVTIMCFLGRRKGRRQKEGRWKALNDSERGENKHISSFMGLRVSVPDPTIPNPFGSDSPVLNSSNTLGENSRIFVGRKTNSHTPELRTADKAARISPMSLDTSTNVFSPIAVRSAGDVAVQAKAISPQSKVPRHNSAASNYLNLSDDEEETSKPRNAPMDLPRRPSPAVLGSSGAGSGLPSNPRPIGKPPSPVMRLKKPVAPFASARSDVTSSTSSVSRPAMAALITALDAPPPENIPPPSPASSYASGFTAIATSRASMRVSMAERPKTMTLDPLAENSDLEDPPTPKQTIVPKAMTTALEAARPETLTIDPAVNASILTVGSTNSPNSADSELSSSSQAPASSEVPTFLRPGWASVSEYGQEGSRDSALTFASSELGLSRDSVDARRRGSEESKK